MAKEVKKPRKPATKKATKEKKVKEETVQVESKVTLGEENELELVNLKPEETNPVIQEDLEIEMFGDGESGGNETDPEMHEDEKDNDLEKAEEENQLKPQEIIEEFTKATKKLDSIMISENPEEVLKKELEKANEVAEQLKKQIKEQESNYYNPGKTWNGVSDGWYDY